MPDRTEQHRRRNINNALPALGWLIQDREHVDITAGRGAAICEFPLKSRHGFGDYLLYLDGGAAGVVEAKKVGVALTRAIQALERSLAESRLRSLVQIVEDLQGARDNVASLRVKSNVGQLHF